MAKSDVIGCLFIGHIEGELCLQQCVGSAPVHYVLHIYPLCQVPLIEMDALQDVGVAITLSHHEGLSEGSFLHADFSGTMYRHRLLVERGFLYLPCRPLGRPAVVEHHEAKALSLLYELLVGFLVQK